MNAIPKFTNALFKEQSPYLLQHAHNPVNWVAWSSEIFISATTQNKPILLSIGYSACHWCHVMERESFEDEEVAAFMNQHFINVKLDREERPDIDQIYMDALQAMTGSGGWPLNIFLLPNGKPFYGGTYFPPKKMPQRASWMEVLKGVHEAFENNLDQLQTQAENLTSHLIQSNIKSAQTSLKNNSQTSASQKYADYENSEAPIATMEDIQVMTERLLQQADTQWGGFGGAPKFPQTFSLQFLLRSHYAFNKVENRLDGALVHTIRTIDKMIQGGIYDVLGGGFARYSTDVQWQAPHFEKMLYDNALLVSLISEAYQVTQKITYKKVIEETIDFVCRELYAEGTSFYAALDADSEGVEGKFYTWSYDEIKEIIDPAIFKSFCSYYQIVPEGNWEHTNILWTINPFEESATPAFEKAKQQLFQVRSSRVRPGLDHKIVLSWNCLMVMALCKSYAAIGTETYKEKAKEVMNWLEENMYDKVHGCFYHSQANGQNKSVAFLEDYANLIQAYFQLNKITGEKEYLMKAKKWMEFLQEHFLDEEGVYFYYTSIAQKDILLRKKDNYDGATASGNAMACQNLYLLGSLFDEPKWVAQSEKMIAGIRKMLIQYPGSFAYWGQTFYLMAMGLKELVGVGPSVKLDLNMANKAFLPNVLTLFSIKSDRDLPWTIGREGIDNQYFMCQNQTCSTPKHRIEEILALI